MSAPTIAAVGPEEMAAGFALAGVPTIAAASTSDGVARLTEALARPDLAIVLADEGYIAALPDDVRRRVLRRPTPVLVPVPRARWAAATGDVASYLLDLLQRAIGYRMRLT